MFLFRKEMIYMKKSLKVLACLSASLIMTTSVFAAKVQLYALDGRTMYIDESQVELYTAEGMGWFLDAPVTMYAADGRTTVVPADKVEAYKNVGWFLAGELDGENTPQEPEDSVTAPGEETQPPEASVPTGNVLVKYIDGTTVSVPAYYVAIYEALGWERADSSSENVSGTVIMYNAEGVAKEVALKDVEKYELAGWTTTKPGANNSGSIAYVKLYYHDGTTKDIPQGEVEAYKAKGWANAYDEAVYTYATKGDGGENLGAVALLEDKKYELAFNNVQDALDKLENTESEYVSLLYYLRTSITDSWREAANSPLGFINYWFNEKDSKRIIVFEYRNISNSRIQSFRINFDICDKDGNTIETNSGSYYVNNLQMIPCEKKRVGWAIESGEAATSITNLKVMEVAFSDGTVWKAAN